MKESPIYLLLADDDKDDCELFKEALAELKESTELKMVHDGEQLMHFLKKGTSRFPNVLFLDLNMPRKNGFECLTEIRVTESLKDLPVIIFSTSFDKEVVRQLYNNGAQYYIRKPSEFSLLKKIIHHAISFTAAADASQPSFENFVLQP